MSRSISSAILMLLALSPLSASAQQFPGRLGGGCVQLSENRQHFVPINVNAPAGATLIVSVATSSRFISGLEVSDPQGSLYQGLGGTRSNTGSVVHLRAALQRPLSAGQVVLITYENSDDSTFSCASVQGFSGIAFGNEIQEAIGSSRGMSSLLQIPVSAATSTTRKLIFGSFATNAWPGAISANSPAASQPALCSAGNALCLVEAQYFSNAGGNPSISLNAANVVTWAGTLTALQADGIFGNGFD